MFANRYTAFIDACTLARVLPRNLLLSLAEADFFRVRWSGQVLDETERAISWMLHKRGNTIEEAQFFFIITQKSTFSTVSAKASQLKG